MVEFRREAILVTLATAWLAGFPAPAQVVLTGRVVDSQALPVTGAAVTLRRLLSGSRASQQTGESGQFRFEGLAPSQYRLTAASGGMAEQSILVDLDSRDMELELRLAPAALRQQVTVVSGSRVEELREDSPSRVEAVTREQMEQTGYERAADALAELPGVMVRGGSRASATVAGEQIQGIDSRQVLVLRDGLPLVGARGIKSGALNLNRQPTGPLERVEVVKGASSPLYGSDAIGGVINLITREPSQPFEGGVSVSGGSLFGLDARTNVGTRWRGFSLFLDLERHQQQAYGLISNSTVTVGPEFQRNDLFWKSRYSLNSRASLLFNASAYHNRDTGLTRSTNNDSVQNYSLAGDFLIASSTSLQARAYAARYDENSQLDVSNLNERYRRLDATLSRPLGTLQFLQFGGEWAQDQYKGANRLVGDNAGQQVTTNDLWWQDRLQVRRWLGLSGGGRYQRHSLFGNHAVSRAGVVTRISERLVLRGSFAGGFRAPDLGQLYYRFANPANFYQVIGNPGLGPETSRSWSAGALYTRSRFRAGLSLYRNDVANLIDSQLAGTPRTTAELEALLSRYGIPAAFEPLVNRQTYIYRNVNRIFTQGFETDADVALTSRLRWQGAFTFLDARDKITGLRLAQRHRFQGFLKTEYVNPRRGLVLNLRGTFFSSWLLNPAERSRAYPYRIWHIYASKDVGQGFRAYGAIDNLFNSTDRKLRDPVPSFDRPDFGRSFRAGLHYSFQRKER